MIPRPTRDEEREAEEIRRLLRRHGGRDYDPNVEDPATFQVVCGSNGQPHSVGGFLIDPFRVWPAEMGRLAAVLVEHGYRVDVREYFDGEILDVTPPPRRPRWSWIRKVVRR